MIKSLFLFVQKQKNLTRILLILWALTILFACFVPSSNIPKIDAPFIDKWVHFIIFGVFSFLWAMLLKKPKFATLFLIFLISSLFGLAVECIQGSGLVRGRSFEWNDFFADSIGSAMGLLLFFALNKKYNPTPKS